MARLDFSVDWHSPPEDEATGPESVTWAHLGLRVDDVVLTRNRPTAHFVAGEPSEMDTVEGPLAGVAEWVVDHFAEILWETTLPFPKHPSLDGQPSFGIPSLRDAAAWWGSVSGQVDRARLAAWQQRHTLGVACSQLALPSLVFVPEAGRIALFASAAPEQLDPNVRHILPQEVREFWLERDDLRTTLRQLVDGVLDAAKASASHQTWTQWLEKRWLKARELEQADEYRRRLRFGKTTAQLWQDRIVALGSTAATAVEGILDDLRELASADEGDRVINVVTGNSSQRTDNAAWRRLHRGPSDLAAPAFKQGYQRAKEVREHLGRGTDPIQRVDVVLAELGVEDRELDSNGLFRSACVVRDRRATVIVSSDVKGVTHRRTAMATALGRVLFDA